MMRLFRKKKSDATKADEARFKVMNNAAWFIEYTYGKPVSRAEHEHRLEKLREVALLLEEMHVDGHRYRNNQQNSQRY